MGEPLVVAVEGTNVTLTCTDDQSVPPAKTVWQRTVEHKAIEQGSKYVMSQEGPVFSLTIVNLTKDDEGTYFCRSENPVDVRELEVYLTVKRKYALCRFVCFCFYRGRAADSFGRAGTKLSMYMHNVMMQ